ncbi:MAG TPA: nuclear transport factor 2 family protein [Polyangiaceae bacterium]|jgi:3-phenylpropionate/cinnamic acid dioxygenase small subunit|nr:nuclear transport factor 2 family protein [Polyangiaceae bacterium]
MTAHHLSLEDISDRIQIQDLLTRYALAIDSKDWALLDTCFAAGAQIDYTSTGGKKGPYSEVREWLRKVLSSFAVTVHFLGNTSVELEGERARAHTYLWNPMGFQQADGSLHWFTVSAQYRDELVRTSDGWRIQQRVQERGVIIGALPGRDS